MIARAAACDTTCILGCSGDAGFVHTVHDDNLLRIVLTCTRDAACTQCTGNGATLVNNEVLDDCTLAATVRVATKVTEEALTLLAGTIDNHVLDAEALTVERAVVLLAVVRANRTVINLQLGSMTPLATRSEIHSTLPAL